MLFEKKILSAYRKIAFSRAEGDPLAYYFSHTDFEGLFCEEYPFPSRHGHTLAGRLYFYENPIPGRLVVFDHGMGAGHRAYLREIEELCRHGYLVLAYDHTGCVESGGAGMRGLCSSLSDLDDCLRFIECARRELPDRFVLQNWNVDPNFGCPFLKIRMKDTFVQERAVPVSQDFSGVWVDIFPLLPFPEQKATKAHMILLRLWERAYQLKCGYDLNSITDGAVSRMLNRVLKLLGMPFTREWMRRCYEKLLTPVDSSPVTLECTSFFSAKLLFPSALFAETVQLPFEDTAFPAPAGHIEYLERMYGDYMQLPPEEDRQKGHSLMIARTVDD